MSHNNPPQALQRRVGKVAARSSDVRTLAYKFAGISLALMCFVIVSGVDAAAADLGEMKVHAKTYKHAKKVAYYGCRTGWWQAYCDGMRQPRWATRCRR